jgi:M6 family metalloprotease-like protein
MPTRRSPAVFLTLAALIASLLAISPLALAASGAVAPPVPGVSTLTGGATTGAATTGAASGAVPSGPSAAIPSVGAAAPAAAAHIASGFETHKYAVAVPCPPPLGVGFVASYFSKDDCGFGIFAMSGADITPTSVINVVFFGEDGVQIPGSAQQATNRPSDGNWGFTIAPQSSWPTGDITVKMTVAGDTAPAGQGTFFLNKLGVDFTPITAAQAPGVGFPVTGTLNQIDTDATGAVTKTATAGTFTLRIKSPDGTIADVTPVTAASDGTFSVAVPGSATASITPAPPTYRLVIALVAANATNGVSAPNDWHAKVAGDTPVTLQATPTSLTFDYSFVSSLGWVKPGDTFPLTLRLTNNTAGAVAAGTVTVTIPPVDGMSFKDPAATAGNGTAVRNPDGSITWTAGAFNAPAPSGVAGETLIVEGVAKDTTADPTIVWKNLSTTATMHGSGADQAMTTHGPKVIPLGETFDTARYGDRPFPVVPVDYSDRTHDAAHTGAQVSRVINDPGTAGSTFNLYQEMSYGQLFPEADVPSAGIATATWDTATQAKMSDNATPPPNTCHGATLKPAAGTPLLPERIHDGWYQLPGTTDYYGDDSNGSAYIGAAAGVPQLQDIDSACGPTGKSVHDAAAIADPEINYNDFDTDKDGVVDFFMMLFVGKGGNGDSQLNGTPPYDNIWPHSSDLQGAYVNARGEKGYVTDDPLVSLTGKIQCYITVTATSVSGKKDCDNQSISPTDPSVIHVRVGPYNVNPESAIDHASVISHEYGHSLGLPDFYSTGSRTTYGDWNLMATDKSQNMDVFSKQELGWIVPRDLSDLAVTAGSNQFDVNGWNDSKIDTGSIVWKRPDGTPYTLSGAGIHNGQAYVASLPRRQIIDPATIPSGTHVWWSQSGNDFGCPPDKGHNFDISLPELANLPDKSDVKVTFKTHFDTEWDFDYGFVMTSTDGKTYASLPSSKGYTTATTNPNNNGCQAQYGNGITGTNESYDAGSATVDRSALGNSYPDTGKFSDDEYHFTSTAGKPTTLRFTYSTDAGVAKPGWFIDDLKIEAGGQTVYTSDFESTGSPTDTRIYNGGCRETVAVAATCTKGWQYVDAASASPADHAYYLEMRDRSGFDADSHGQNDRDPIGFEAGLLLTYTDESHGYGNLGTADPPAQSPLDSTPQVGNDAPNLNDAAFTAAAGRTSYSDATAVGGHTDNYLDPSSPSGNWEFKYNCLSFLVLSMSGNDVGPTLVAAASDPSELKGNVRFTLGPSCGTYDYGFTRAASSGGGGATCNRGDGYRLVAADGGVFNFGSATPKGSMGGTPLNRPIVGTAPTPTCGGYWMVASDGGLFSFGDAAFYGSTGSMILNQPIVAMTPTPSGKGYWMVASDGGIFSFGDARFFGSMGSTPLNKPVVGMASTPSGMGYWLVASDGGIFAFGDARFFGSTGSTPLNQPIVGMARTPTGNGYWFVASDGGMFAFGDAPFVGSLGSTPLNKPIVGMAPFPAVGYWLVASDGGVFSFGNARFFGSTGGISLNQPIVAMAGLG